MLQAHYITEGFDVLLARVVASLEKRGLIKEKENLTQMPESEEAIFLRFGESAFLLGPFPTVPKIEIARKSPVVFDFLFFVPVERRKLVDFAVVDARDDDVSLPPFVQFFANKRPPTRSIFIVEDRGRRFAASRRRSAHRRNVQVAEKGHRQTPRNRRRRHH